MIPLLTPEGEVAAIQQMGLVIAAVITAGFAYLGVTQDRTRRHAKASREQLENSHKTNLRDDLDALRDENNKRFTRIEDHLGIERTLQPGRTPPPSRKRWRRR